MSAILGILKVIGILLLILLGILLLLIIMILFCPIRYQAAGAKDSAAEDTPGFTLQVSARWLLGLLRFRYQYPKPGALKVKLLGFTLYDSSKPPKNPKQEQAEKSPQASGENEVPVSETGADTQKEAPPKVAKEAFRTANEENPAKAPKEAPKEAPVEQEKATVKRSLPEKLKHFYQEFCFYKDFWNARETQELLTKVLNRFKRILRSVLPKIEADLLIGTGQPDTTGYVMAVYGILIPFLGRKVNITPDFEQPIIEGYFKAKGNICIFTLLRHTLSILFDKNLRIVYKRFKRHKAKVAKEAAEQVKAPVSTESEE